MHMHNTRQVSNVYCARRRRHANSIRCSLLLRSEKHSHWQGQKRTEGKKKKPIRPEWTLFCRQQRFSWSSCARTDHRDQTRERSRERPKRSPSNRTGLVGLRGKLSEKQRQKPLVGRLSGACIKIQDTHYTKTGPALHSISPVPSPADESHQPRPTQSPSHRSAPPHKTRTHAPDRHHRHRSRTYIITWAHAHAHASHRGGATPSTPATTRSHI